MGDYSFKRAASGGDRWIVNKAPVGAQALFKGGGEMYLTLSDLIQVLLLICEIVTVLLLALDTNKRNKK